MNQQEENKRGKIKSEAFMHGVQSIQQSILGKSPERIHQCTELQTPKGKTTADEGNIVRAKHNRGLGAVMDAREMQQNINYYKFHLFQDYPFLYFCPPKNCVA